MSGAAFGHPNGPGCPFPQGAAWQPHRPRVREIMENIGIFACFSHSIRLADGPPALRPPIRIPPAFQWPRSGFHGFQCWHPGHSRAAKRHPRHSSRKHPLHALSCPQSGFLPFLVDFPPSILPLFNGREAGFMVFNASLPPVGFPLWTGGGARPPGSYASLSLSSRPLVAGARPGGRTSQRRGRLWKVLRFSRGFCFLGACGRGQRLGRNFPAIGKFFSNRWKI